jgi:hypothetical protein
MTDDDFVRDELRRAAAEHRPDRTVMLNRIAANRATDPRRRGRAWRMAGSAAAVIAVLGLGGVGRWALAGDHGDKPVAPVAQPSPTVSPSAPRSVLPSARPTTKRPTSKPPVGAPPKGGTGNTRVEQGPMWSDGSIDKASTTTEGLSDVTVKVSAPITKLVVTLRVALTPGVTDQGATHQVPHASIASTVVHQPDALVYRFALAAGDTLPAGTYVFTGHYAHERGGRDAGGDTYEATATTATGQKLDVYGNFYPVS